MAHAPSMALADVQKVLDGHPPVSSPKGATAATDPDGLQSGANPSQVKL